MNVLSSDNVELVVESRARIGEGPSWDSARGRLLWVDIMAHAVHSHDLTAGDETMVLEQQVGAVVPRAGGGLALALEDGFWLTDSDDAAPQLLAAVEPDDPTTRFNDGKCDPRGRFWAGTMAHDARAEAGALYRLEGDGRAYRAHGGVTISNGLGWNLAHDQMYYIDSIRYAVDVFDFDLNTGTVANHRQLFATPREAGVPDGMTVDAEGYLWIAFYGGWSVRRYSPAGDLDRIVRVPVAHVTSCAFGGSDLGDLYITSATNGLTPEQLEAQPLAGGLFVHQPGVSGLLETPFAG